MDISTLGKDAATIVDRTFFGVISHRTSTERMNRHLPRSTEDRASRIRNENSAVRFGQCFHLCGDERERTLVSNLRPSNDHAPLVIFERQLAASFIVTACKKKQGVIQSSVAIGIEIGGDAFALVAREI